MADTFLMAAWPVVCDECRKALAKSVYNRRDLDAVTLYCPHLSTLAMAKTGEHQGKRAVMQWQVVGPLGHDEAVAMMCDLSGIASFEDLSDSRVN